jgi:hypothetical protein
MNLQQRLVDRSVIKGPNNVTNRGNLCPNKAGGRVQFLRLRSTVAQLAEASDSSCEAALKLAAASDCGLVVAAMAAAGKEEEEKEEEEKELEPLRQRRPVATLVQSPWTATGNLGEQHFLTNVAFFCIISLLQAHK